MRLKRLSLGDLLEWVILVYLSTLPAPVYIKLLALMVALKDELVFTFKD